MRPWLLGIALAGCAASAAERGRAAAARGDYRAAARGYREALRDEPLDAGLWSALGRALYVEERYPQARAAFEKAAALRPDDPVPRIRIGNTHEIERNWDAALAAYRDATRVAPRDARAWRVLGLRLARWRRLDGAVEALEEAAALDPRSPEAHHNLALVRAARGDLAGAERSFHRAIAARPGYRPSQLGLAGLLVNANRRAEALSLYREIAQSDPPLPAAWIAVALLEDGLGRANRAVEAFERAIDASDGDPQTLDRLARYLLRDGPTRDPARAADLARTGWERSGRQSPVLAATLARALFASGDVAGARAVLVEASRADPADEDLRAVGREIGP